MSGILKMKLAYLLFDTRFTIKMDQIVTPKFSRYLVDELAKNRRKSVNKLQLEFASSHANRIARITRTYPFAKKVSGLFHLMDNYNNGEYQEAALSIILDSPVYERVDFEEAKNLPGFNYTDQLVKELLKWYKEDFFTWVNKLNCNHCGNTNQDKIIGMQPVRPSKSDHFEGQASIIERYKCQNCGRVNEFPRYNNPRTLLETRKGRCGEWNNCFILLLESLGLRTRYIWNAEDHVWCEYFSDNLGRWIHLDSCENAFDNPLLYNDGWAKKMSYVFAVSKDYILDVSTKYLDPAKPDRHLPRKNIPDKELNLFLSIINLEKLSNISDDRELLDVTSTIIRDNNTHVGSITSEIVSSMLPRQSGSKQWAAHRGESGR